MLADGRVIFQGEGIDLPLGLFLLAARAKSLSGLLAEIRKLQSELNNAQSTSGLAKGASL